MALAQPTGLQVQLLEPLVTLSQTVERHNDTDVLIAENGDTLISESGVTLASERLTVVQLMQMVDDSAVFVPGGTVVTLSQEVITLNEVPRHTLVTLKQTVERHVAGGVVVTLRQTVLSTAVAVAAERPNRVYLDDADVTEQTAAELQINASEGDNRTARLWLLLPKGPVNITSYQGRAIEVVRLFSGSPVTLFRGTIDRPVYDYQRRRLELNCSDLRNERIGRESRSKLRTLTGGLFSPVTQREDAEGEQWVAELMKTVEGSLDYTSSGSLRFRPWAPGTPRYTLTDADVHDRDLRFEFATRSEIINTVKGRLEYRFYEKKTLTEGVSVSMRRALDGTGLPRPGDVIPTREAVLSALRGVSGWIVSSGTTTELPDDGWYRPTLADRPIGFSVTSAFRATRATGGGASLKKYISQPKRESYEFTITAPESVDQFGEIEGGDFRYAAESNIDPEVFEERGCSVGPDDDRRSDVNLAIQALQAIAAKQIKAGHRQNYVELTYKADILPLEIGDTVAINTDTVTATGFVVEFGHTLTASGDYYTTAKLALSRADSAVSVTEDFTLPAQPTKFELNAESLILPETPDCPAVSIEGSGGAGSSRIEPDGTVIVVAPAIDRREIDELVGTRSTNYDVEIPRDTFTVEVV